MSVNLKPISAIFKDAGYEGATLSRLSRASGLKRASLYHHFPGGKADMAGAVLADAGAALARLIIAPLRTTAPPAERIRFMIDGVRKYYGARPEPCLMETLSIGGGRDRFAGRLKGAAEAWIAALAHTLEDSGLEARTARDMAEDFLAGVEGALVLSRVFGDNRLEAWLGRAERRLLDAID